MQGGRYNDVPVAPYFIRHRLTPRRRSHAWRAKHWSPMGENPVLEAMRETRFDIMGVNRSYLDFYMGFGYSLSVAELMVAALLWQLASAARTDAVRVRPIIAVIALATVATGAIAWRFIFPVPALLCAVLLASLLVALGVARE